MSKNDEQPERGISRRRFCQLAGASACGLATGGSALVSADFLRPRVLFEPPTRFALGPAVAMTVGSVITEEKHKVFVMRFQDGFRALSSVCTHLGCITRYQPDENIIACPCHGSRFTLDGDVIEGPAPRPLRWLEMALSAQGEILVDTAFEVPLGTVFKL